MAAARVLLTAAGLCLLALGSAAPRVASGRDWVDPATPPANLQTAALGSGQRLALVFSDEFTVPHRSFADGEDPRWTALEKNDYTNDALHFYKERAISTRNGSLSITTKAQVARVEGYDDVKRRHVNEVKNITSGMLQSWNKFCFVGGAVEARIQLPGRHNRGGLWPAFWLLGNLARHTYVGSSNWIWPWSFSDCDEALRHKQLINGCSSTSHFGMHKGQGRGAPEIDILEVQPGPDGPGVGDYLESGVGQPFVSTSLQVSPGMASHRPGPGSWPGPGEWYRGIEAGRNSCVNINFYGTYNHFPDEYSLPDFAYWSDAISWNTQLASEHFDSFHTYRLEWEPPLQEDPQEGGYLQWFIDGELALSMNSSNLAQSHTGAEIPSEPAYILLNVAVSKNWGFPKGEPGDTCPRKCFDCNHAATWECTCGLPAGFCEQLPSEMLVDYVRVYQDEDNPAHKVGCSIPERPTKDWINGHAHAYKRPEDSTPLLHVGKGGGSCVIGANDCGEDAGRGKCVMQLLSIFRWGLPRGICRCEKKWVGGHCRSPDAGDPVNWDPDVSWMDIPFSAPMFHGSLMLSMISVVLGFIGVLHLHLRRPRVHAQTTEGI